MNKSLSQPYYHPAQNKKHKVLIILLHYLGGEPQQLKQHIMFLNQNGYDVYAYPAFLHGTAKNLQKLFFLIKQSKTGVLKTWAKELDKHLKSLPTGPKLIFSFSMPSVIAFFVASKRHDIQALICDGGPFLDLPTVSWRLVSSYYLPAENGKNKNRKLYPINYYIKQIPMFLVKLYFTIKICWVFRPLLFAKSLKEIKLSKNFPVLNFRAEQDQQVKPSAIQKFFQKITPVQLTVCQLKQSDHLRGLKKERTLYIKTVLDFLNRYAKTTQTKEIKN